MLLLFSFPVVLTTLVCSAVFRNHLDWTGKSLLLRISISSAVRLLRLLEQVCAGISAVCHVLITGTIFHYLWRVKKNSMTRRSTTLITRLIKLTVETGLICAAANLMALILFVSSPRTLLYIMPIAMTSKLYSNCLLAVGLLSNHFFHNPAANL